MALLRDSGIDDDPEWVSLRDPMKMRSSKRGLSMDWAQHGVKIVHSDELDLNTPQTSGMTRAAAITHARAGANKLWPVRCWFSQMPRPGHITMENWRLFSTSSRAEFESAGAINWNLARKPGRATLFTFRLTCHTRRSMQAQIGFAKQ